MKFTILALILSVLSPFAMAEDSVTCEDVVDVAWTDKSTLHVSGLLSFQVLRSLEIQQKGDSDYVRIENDKTVLRNFPLRSVRLTIDNGTSMQSVLVIDWSKFEDGGIVPVEVFDRYPNGDLNPRKVLECGATQS